MLVFSLLLFSSFYVVFLILLISSCPPSSPASLLEVDSSSSMVSVHGEFCVMRGLLSSRPSQGDKANIFLFASISLFSLLFARLSPPFFCFVSSSLLASSSFFYVPVSLPLHLPLHPLLLHLPPPHLSQARLLFFPLPITIKIRFPFRRFKRLASSSLPRFTADSSSSASSSISAPPPHHHHPSRDVATDVLFTGKSVGLVWFGLVCFVFCFVLFCLFVVLVCLSFSLSLLIIILSLLSSFSSSSFS